MGNTYPARFEQTIPGLNYLIDSWQINQNKSWPANNASVQNWTPLLNNGKFGTLTQATSGLRPTFVENANNNRPGIAFSAAANQTMAATMNGSVSDLTIFLVCKVTNATPDAQNLYYMGDVYSNGIGFGVEKGNNYIWLGGDNLYSLGSATTNTTLVTISWKSSTTTMIGRINGVEQLNFTHSYAAPSPQQLSLGAPNVWGHFDGSIFYAAQYDRALGSTEINQMEQYLSGKFGRAI